MADRPRRWSRQASSSGECQSRRYSRFVSFARGASEAGSGRSMWMSSRFLSRGCRETCSSAEAFKRTGGLIRSLRVSSAGNEATGASPASVMAVSSRQNDLSRGIAASPAKPASVIGTRYEFRSSTPSRVATAARVASVGWRPFGSGLGSRKTVRGSWKYWSPIASRIHRGAGGEAPGTTLNPWIMKSYQIPPPTSLIDATARRWVDARRTFQPSRPPTTMTSSIKVRRLKANRRRGFAGEAVVSGMARSILRRVSLHDNCRASILPQGPGEREGWRSLGSRWSLDRRRGGAYASGAAGPGRAGPGRDLDFRSFRGMSDQGIAEVNPLRQALPRARVPEPCSVVLFGATGDLTHRKLVPALYHLDENGHLPGECAIVGFARRGWGDDAVPGRAEAQAARQPGAGPDFDRVVGPPLAPHLAFSGRAPSTTPTPTARLRASNWRSVDATRPAPAATASIYLAVAPGVSSQPIVEHLGQSRADLRPPTKPSPWSRVVDREALRPRPAPAPGR